MLASAPSLLRSVGGRLVRLVRRVFAEPMGFVWGALITTISSTIAFLIMPHARLEHLLIIHLFGAVLISTRYGLAVSTFTAVMSALAFDYFCVPPIFAFALPDTHSVATFAGMLITALTFCYLNQRLRQQWLAARASEARTLALCELSLDLSDVTRVDDVPARAERHLSDLFGAGTRVLLRRAHFEPGIVQGDAGKSERTWLSIASETSSEVQPIGEPPENLGVIRIPYDARPMERKSDRRKLLAACADRIAVALERLALRETARRVYVEAETERSRNALLSAASHDLKTPLSSILTAGTTLLRRDGYDGEDRELLETIVEETERMNALITNLLSATRLESGNVRLNRAPEALEELIFGVLSRLSGRLEGRAVDVQAARDLPFVFVDSALVDQTIANLLENVLRYTPAGSPIEIAMEASSAEVLVEIRDRGPGIAADERERVFEKFYRGKQLPNNDGGTGLGLTICRAVARAHGGWIRIKARPQGGTIVEFAFPRFDPQQPRSGFDAITGSLAS